MIQTLVELGVRTVFGYPGGAVLSLYDSIAASPLEHILVRHEQAAAHAADGYARATGRVGVCIATSGPGATNLITGLATAYMDSIPVVAVTGQVAIPLIGRDAFQEADITGITAPITKHNFLVKDARELPGVLRQAFHLASTGRPGPVLVDVPRDVAAGRIAPGEELRADLPGYRPVVDPKPLQIKKACEKLGSAQRPVILAGGGVITSGASGELRKLAEKTGIPVTCTLMGLGAFPGGHELFLGMPGMHGTAAANTALMESDLILGVGVRFDDRVTGMTCGFAPSALIVHIDIDPAEIGKNVRVDVPIVADAGKAMSAMIPRVSASDRREPWRRRLAELKRDRPVRYSPSKKEIKPQYVIEELFSLTGGRATVVTDVGQHQMWTAQFYRFSRPRTFISSGGLGTMGYGLPAAIGAWLGARDSAVWLISGDGSFQMNLQELATVTRYRIPLRICVMNNGYLGMVRQWQELFFGGRYSHVAITGPDFVKLAGAYGIRALRVERPEDVPAALLEADRSDGAVLLEFVVAPREGVYPMVPSGRPLNEMISGD